MGVVWGKSPPLLKRNRVMKNVGEKSSVLCQNSNREVKHDVYDKRQTANSRQLRVTKA